MRGEKKRRKWNTHNGKAEGKPFKGRKMSTRSRAGELRQLNWKGIKKNKENHIHTEKPQ